MVEEDREELTPEEIEADRSPDNAANAVAVTRKKKNTKSAERLRQEVLVNLLATKPGRDLLRFLIFEVCGVHSTTENQAYDTNGMHFKEGARQVGFKLQAMCIGAAANSYATLFKEHIVRED